MSIRQRVSEQITHLIRKLNQSGDFVKYHVCQIGKDLLVCGNVFHTNADFNILCAHPCLGRG